jgi:hypothetical protein
MELTNEERRELHRQMKMTTQERLDEMIEKSGKLYEHDYRHGKRDPMIVKRPCGI